ncbi:carbamoyl-phosphate synthase [Myxococcus sp. K15C18031901]|uniref:carboxylate--amine ligase n=1 Tax=Myxococcus dinghuensis TaxID=2906761 RepID=UPI0020A6F2C1|nr:carbamoyl-phosphate synthase [Myxococcus dinghuensis]MCP3097519.1 carbamoyl-phosphate synthase [Myxococcus dinghuensis]
MVEAAARARVEGRPSALLFSASFYGTLAAARCFGRNGIAVTVADPGRLGPASWSRFVGRRVQCPPESQPEAFMDWLLDFGRQEPFQHVLYPTSDELAWLVSVHAAELKRYFHLYDPGVAAVYGLLNKRKLFEAGQEVGLKLPRTWFPESEEDLEAISREARFPVLIKPTTQILYSTHRKGLPVAEPSQLVEEYRAFARDGYAPMLVKFDPAVARPMVQEFHPEAAQGIYSLSGFVDETGELFEVRGAMKVLQRPRRLGVGVCFESAPVRDDLAEGLQRLCKRLGYHGVFEVEFIQTKDDFLLIDFNPRYYGQMGFDIARGLPLPLLAYHAAVGDQLSLQREVEHARAWKGRGEVFCNRIALEMLLNLQRLSGALPVEEARQWRRWLGQNREVAVDPLIDADDLMPTAVELAQILYGSARHPRAFVRMMVLNR